MSAIKLFFRDTAIYGAASVLPRLINFALIRVYTQVFDTAEFSSQTKWYVYAAFINVVLTLGLETSFFRFYTSEKDKAKVISSAFILLLLSSLIFLATGLLTSKGLSGFFGFSDSRYLQILIWTTVFDTMVVIPFALLRVSGRPVKFMLLKVTNVVFLAVGSVFLLIVLPSLAVIKHPVAISLGIGPDFKPQVIHIFIANVVASILTFVTLLPELFKISLKSDRLIIKKMLNYGIPIMIGGLAYVINENIDKLIIPKFLNEDANGIYAACYKLGVFMTLYITAFRMGAEPFFFNHAGTADARQKYSFIMTWFVILGCIFMLIVVGFVDLFAGIFLRQKAYLQGLAIVPVILLANLFSGIYNNLSIWYKLTDKTRFGMYISLFGGGITIISLLVFVPLMGIMGGAVATLATYFIMACISWYFGSRFYPVDYEWRKLSVIILTTVVLSTLSFIFFRGNILLNSLLILVFMAIIYLSEAKSIKNLA